MRFFLFFRNKGVRFGASSNLKTAICHDDQPANLPTCQPANLPTNRFSRICLLLPQALLLVLLFMITLSCRDDMNTRLPDIEAKNDQNPHLTYLRKSRLQEGKLSPRSSKYSLTDALGFVNDGLNYLYCRPDDYYNETLIFVDTIDLVVDGSDEVDTADLVDLMDKIAYFAGGYFYPNAIFGYDTIGEPLMFDVRQAGAPAGGYVPVEVVFFMERGEFMQSEEQYPYEHSWLYGAVIDATNICNSEGVDADAADLFRKDLRRHVVYRNKLDQYSYYFKNPYTTCFVVLHNSCGCREIELGEYFPDEVIYGTDLANPGDVTPYDNYYDYLLFYNSSSLPDFHDCISQEEMNFYFESMRDLALDLLPSPSGGIVIAQVEVGHDLLATGTSYPFHCLMVIEATKVSITPAEPILLPCCP